jgi:hypothetical protein
MYVCVGSCCHVALVRIAAALTFLQNLLQHDATWLAVRVCMCDDDVGAFDWSSCIGAGFAT